MTVSAPDRLYYEYVADGLATERNIGFPLRLPTDLVVAANGVPQVLGQHYSIVGAAPNQRIRPLAPFWPSGAVISYWRVTGRAQEYDVPAGVDIRNESLEDELDRIALQQQEQDAELDRAIKVARGQAGLELVSSGLSDGDLLEYRGNRLQRFDAAPFSGKLYGGAAGTGRPVPVSGTGVDAALRDDLASTDGAEFVGADDGAGGSLWSNLAGFIARLRSSVGSAIVGFIQAGIGAVARPAQAKMRDIIDAKDFGARGDNATDDYGAIMAALAAHGRVHLSHTTSNTYRVSQPIALTDNQVLTADPEVVIFGTGSGGALLLTGNEVFVDVGEVVAPSALYCVRYYNLVWSIIKIRRAGMSSKAVIFMDGAAQTFNAGVNEWHVGDIQAGSCELGIWLKNSSTYTYEGDIWNIRCILSATVCALRIGDVPASRTLRWNRFRVAVDAQGITPLLVEFRQEQNDVDLYNWAGLANPPEAHVIFNAAVGGNNLYSVPGIQDPLIVRDYGFNTWRAQGQAGNQAIGAVSTFGYVADTGLEIVNAENKSAANNTTKYVGYGLQGRDTANSGKLVGGVRAVPQDADWVNGTLTLRTRMGDAEVAIAFFGINGTPEGQIAAPVGAIATRRDGGASTTFYVKQSGTGNTGWVAK